MNKLIQLRQTEWRDIEARATRRYKHEHLGDEPTWKNTSPLVPHSSPTSIIMWGAILLLLVLVVFTLFKSFDPAIEFADSFNRIQSYSPTIASIFTVISMAVAGLITTTGLIFTTIQATEPETLLAQRRYPLKASNFWKLEVLTPRLWSLSTYFVIAWLFIISSRGEGSWFMKYLPVILEVVLAHTVKDVIQNFRIRHKEVHDVWAIRHKQWVLDLDNRYASPNFLRILFQEMREALTLLRRGRQRPNAWLDTADASTILKVLTEEYKRLTAGIEFASALTQMAQPKNAETPYNMAHRPKIAYNNGELRIPPDNAVYWTPETLKQDFMVRGLSPSLDYKESQLDREYAGSHRVRAAFRGQDGKNGARLYFESWR